MLPDEAVPDPAPAWDHPDRKAGEPSLAVTGVRSLVGSLVARRHELLAEVD